MKKLILSIVALAAISITSCSSDDQTVDTKAQAKEQEVSNNGTKKALVDLCSVSTASVTVNRWQAPSSVDANWTPVAATIGGVNVQWEGIYGASIRPVSNAGKWYVGTVDLSETCDEWSTWKTAVDVKNVIANLGTAPSNKYNVLGYNGTISGTNYGLGYYSYNITTHVMTPAKAIVIWKTNSGTDETSVTNPTSATEAYLVKVTSVSPGASSSTINYNWTKVL